MTKSQKIASNPNYSVWVAASAGTGKTKVLTDRVLRLLLEGNLPGKILCLTFTKAAAAEMANRINKELGKWVIATDSELASQIEELIEAKPDDEIMERARRLFLEVLDTPDGIKIQTIHSFCQSLMKRFPLEAEIAPHFQIMDDKTSLEFMKEARIRLISEKHKYSEIIEKSFADLSWRVSEGSFSELLQELINQRGRFDYLLSRYTVDEIIRRIYETLDVAEDATEEGILRMSYLSTSLRRVERSEHDVAISINDEIASSESLCSPHRNDEFDHNGLEMAAKDIKDGAKIIAWLKAIKLSNSHEYELLEEFTKYKTVFLTTEDKPRARMVTKAIMEKNPAIEEILLREQRKVMAVDQKLKSLCIAKLSADLFHIMEAMLALYKKSKNTMAFLDYSDLILASMKLLEKQDIAPWILYKLDEGIDHLLVDEAQDTSPEQWKVIKALCDDFFSGEGARDNSRTIFVVGDEKQSIFSFQGADPAVFDAMHKSFAEKVRAVEKGWQSVSLEVSFRSTQPILQCVDAVFANEKMRKAITKNAEKIEHSAHRSQYAGRVELWPLEEKEQQEKNEEIRWEMPIVRKAQNSAKRNLVEKIADTIEGWIRQGRILESKGRPVQAGDILILVRKRDEKFINPMVRALKKRNIGVAGVDRMILTDHIAVMDILALGEFLLLPEDSLTLAVILKSPIIGISEDELFTLAYDRGEMSLWESLRDKSTHNETFAAAYAFLLNLLNKTDFMSPFELYSYILEGQGVRKKLAARLGNEIHDPINELLAALSEYERSHPPALQGFLNWILAGNTEIKRDLDQGGNEVRIMTVHGSKGLQAPIVFMPDTTSLPTSRDKVIWTPEEESLPLWYCGKENLNHYGLELYERNKELQYEEYLRLLYVAMTRAEDELYIAGLHGNGRGLEDSWYSLIKNGLAPIAEKDGDRLVLSSKQMAKVVPVHSRVQANNNDLALPDFIDMPVAEEPVPSIPLSPSKMHEDESPVQSPINSKAVLRGKIIHKLLEYLPEIEESKRRDIAENFVKNSGYNFNDNEKKELVESAFRILQDARLVDIFGKNSQAEVPVVGVFGEYVLAGMIDRLVVTSDSVIIIDYKTNRTPPKAVDYVHPNYKKQMAAYKKALEEIYPDKTIKCMLIWTEGPVVMEI